MSKNLRFVNGYRKVRQSSPLIYGGDFLFLKTYQKAAEDNDTDSVKEEIRKIFTQYIKIKGNDVESHVNILISHIMVANLKLDPSMILAGSTAKNIIFKTLIK